MSSTERFDAASISITSSDDPAAIVRQDSHSPQGVTRRPVDAVERAGEDLRQRRLAGAARADEEVGVVDAVLLDRVAQGAHDVLLADHLVEALGAVAAVEGRFSHGRASLAAASGRSERRSR